MGKKSHGTKYLTISPILYERYDIPISVFERGLVLDCDLLGMSANE